MLFPAIIFFCCIGTFSINNNLTDIYTTALFGLIGYVFLRLGMEPAPLILGFILGPMLEENFRRAMLLSRGTFGVFFTRPISATLLSVIGALVVWQMVVFVLQARKTHGHIPAQPALLGAGVTKGLPQNNFYHLEVVSGLGLAGVSSSTRGFGGAGEDSVVASAER